MLEGGRLTVEVRNISLGQSDVDVNGEARPGDYVMVAVSDTGSGMIAEVCPAAPSSRSSPPRRSARAPAWD